MTLCDYVWQVITGQKAEGQADGSYVAGGNNIVADLTYVTVGAAPNTSFLGSSFPLDAKGFVKV